MIPDRKEYILNKAFEVFMAVGYDSASMTVLQKELGMSRGAMYRYYKSKDELFFAAVDRYVFEILERNVPIFDDNITVKERIELTYRHLQSVGKFLDKIDNIDIKFLNFTALVIQAAKRYPGFLDRLKKYKLRVLQAWETAFKNSIKKGEIRNDVNSVIMAQLFVRLISYTDESGEIHKDFLSGIKSGQRVMNYIYSLIKT